MIGLGIMSPKLGITLIKKQIEKQANIKVKSFSIFHHANYGGLKFNITPIDAKPLSITYEDENGSLTTVIKTLLKDKLDNSFILDAFELKWMPNEISCDIYYTDKNKKISQTIIISKDAN